MEVEHDESNLQFELTVDGHTAVLRYRRVSDGVLDYESTVVPSPLRRRGIGAALVRHALRYAKENMYEVIPTCWFVKKFMDRERASESS